MPVRGRQMRERVLGEDFSVLKPPVGRGGGLEVGQISTRLAAAT